MTEKYLTKPQASAFLTNEMGLPVAVKTLSKYITNGDGPEYQKFGTRVVYRESNLREWANARLSAPIQNSSQGA